MNEVAADCGSAAVESSWRPLWVIDVGHGCEVGLTVDDHCYVVLLPTDAGWKPGSWIPRAVALKIAELGVDPL